MPGRIWLAIGGVLGGLAVLCGAFGAHALPNVLGLVAEDPAEFAKRKEVFETAARYHMYHALAIVAVGILRAIAGMTCRPLGLTIAGLSFLAGIFIFSGCLYALALSGTKWLGAIVPIGGVAFIVGWLALACAGFEMGLAREKQADEKLN